MTSDNNDKKKLFNNFFSLFMVEGLNYIFPLITFPYIIQTIGIEKFGLLSFAAALIAYPALLVIYGLDLSGAREVANSKNSTRKLSIILSSIMLTRLLLIFFSLLLTLTVVFSFDRFAKDWLVYLVTFGSIIGTMSFPTWFFQGMEKMKFITYLTLGSRLLYTIAIFVFVQSEEDFLFVPLLNFLSLFIVGIISLVVIYKEFGVSLQLPRTKYILLQFHKGWYLFISHFSINLFTGLNMIILGMVSSNLIVGYYALAEKVVTIITSLFSPLNQALYPHVVQLVKKSREVSIKFVERIFRYVFLASTLTWIFFVLFSKIIFVLVFGEDSINALPVFYILSALIIIRPLAAWTYNVVLISFKQEKHFVKMFLTAAVVNIIVIVILLPWFGAKENVIAFSLVVSEIIALSLGLYLYKSKVLGSKGSL